MARRAFNWAEITLEHNKWAESNGDYISRFERVERTLDALAKRQDKTQEQLDATDRQIDMQTRDMIGRQAVLAHSGNGI